MSKDKMREEFEAWLGIKPCGAAHDLAWAAWQAARAQPAVKESLTVAQPAGEAVAWPPLVGQRVRAKIDMVNNMREDGMGIELCANAGDELIVRRLSGPFISVSHEYVVDRSFSVTVEEIEPVHTAPPAQPDVDALRAELAEWHKLKDPNALHINLLRGFPAKLDESQLRHIIGDAADAPPAQVPDVRCPHCFGSGVMPKAAIFPEPPDVKCRNCNGSGKLSAIRARGHKH